MCSLPNMLQAVTLSCGVHLQLMQQKQRNIAHRLTGSMAAGVWLHGEAVAAGMVMAVDMSRRLGWIDQELLDRTRDLLVRANLPVAPPQVRVLTSEYILGIGS